MMLVIGGAAAGKRAYVESLGYTEAQMREASLSVRGEEPVLLNLHALVFSDPGGVADDRSLFDWLLAREVITCDEVGAGVIPATREERDAREATGRLCNRLAASAERVVRVVAGIPVVLK